MRLDRLRWIKILPAEGHDPDAVERATLAEVIKSMPARRSLKDVRAEIISAAKTVDPGTDYMFIRP